MKKIIKTKNDTIEFDTKDLKEVRIFEMDNKHYVDLFYGQLGNVIGIYDDLKEAEKVSKEIEKFIATKKKEYVFEDALEEETKEDKEDGM